jgi:hypothetical protein
MTTLLLLLVFASASLVRGGEAPSPVTSPNKQYLLHLTPDAQPGLSIRSASGSVLFTYDGAAELHPEHVHWSPDSEAVVVAGGYPHYIVSYLFVRQGTSFVRVALPDVSNGEDNPWIVPVKWLSGRRLILDITGPHAGKRIEWFYHGRATIRVFTQPPTCEQLYQHFTAKKYDRNA